MRDPSREVVEACITALCGAEQQGLREKVLAVIRTYEDHERPTVRGHESRALLQRLVKYVREDRATTPGKTRLARLTDQVADYLNRTADPRDILRGRPDPARNEASGETTKDT